jgi:pimeloyl-ACP methyl ester carboxylesterase
MTKRFAILIAFLLFPFAMVSGAMPEPKFANFENNKVRYFESGNPKAGSALIFVHGWTCSAEFWRDSINAFPGYRVIAIDLPGHGGSDKPKANYSMEYFARSIDAVMRETGVKKAVLAGHSMGTPVVRQFYRLYPKKTLGLIVVDGALRPYGTKAEMDEYYKSISVNYSEAAPKAIDWMLTPVKDAELRSFIREGMLATPEYVALSASAGMIDEKIWGEDKIEVPVLAIMANSPNWPKGIEQRYRDIAPNIDFQMWDGVSHFLMMERPKEFNGQVKAFVISNKLL